MTAGRFSTDVYAQRLRAASAAAADAGLAGLVITPGYDLRYLIGSRAQTFERLTALVLPASGEPTIVVPRMELASLKESAATELGIAVRDWVDGDDPYRVVADALGGAPAAVAVTDAMPALHLLPLAEVLGVVPVLATDVLRRLRMVKDGAEIDALRKAGAAIDRVHARVPEFLVPGRTEADVAADIAEAIVAEGHSEVAFIIVGSGPHGADPHHECSDRELRAGDIVVVDIGGPYEPGYNSDSTRTYSIGEPDQEVAQRYSVLQRAQQAAVEAVRPGSPQNRSTRSRAMCWPKPASPTRSCIAPATASGCRCTRSPTSSRAMTCRSQKAWPFPSSRVSTFPASGEPASRTSSSSPPTVPNR